ncbi:MAG: DUF4389 domain-containing protein, partial [Acidimicrobiia bacterium]
MSAGKVVLAIFGAMLGLLAVGLLAAGAGLMWAYGTQRSADGYFTSATTELSTGTYALTTAQIDLGSRPGDWFPSGQIATVRFNVEPSSDGPVFIGIGPDDQVSDYLDGVGVAQVTHFGLRGSDVTYKTTQGEAPPTPPEEQTFWVASSQSADAQSLTWDLESGRWAVVIMNADGSTGVNAALSAAASVAILIPIAIGLLIAGAIFGVIAAVMLVFAIRGNGSVPAPVAPAEIQGGYGHYPVRLEAALDPNMSRWQWIFKWFLAIPHYFVLAFLWIAFMLLTVVAGFAILFTGRYPRGIFDFNVGVLRWSWRVGYYSYSALGTDRYPPFTLAPADYPAEFDVQYPAELSRGLVLVKWWLLAIPHYIIVGFFTSGLVWWATNVGESGNAAVRTGGGLIGILVFVAALALLFTGRYPQGLFDLVVGLNRWVFRVAAYAALMRDEYPPFRLDIGGAEPDAVQAAPVGASPSPEPPPSAELPPS